LAASPGSSPVTPQAGPDVSQSPLPPSSVAGQSNLTQESTNLENYAVLLGDTHIKNVELDMTGTNLELVIRRLLMLVP
jgi:hypothetical protein